MKFLRVVGFIALAAFLLLIELGCGDQYRPVANPIVSPGGQPQTTHFAWVVNYNASGNGSTTEIDVSGDTNLAVNTMGIGAIAEAFPASSLSLYVANNGNDTVSQYLPTLAGAITTINLLPGSHPITLTSVQNTVMYVLNSGTNSACPTTGSISTISATTLTVTGTYCVGVNPVAMVQSPTNGWIYILNQGDDSVSAFNPSGPFVVGTITAANGLGLNPVSVTVNSQGWIFVVTQGDGVHPGTLDLIPAGYYYIAATLPLGIGPTYSVVDPNLNRLYVANTVDNTVSVFDASNVNQANNPAMPLLATVSKNMGTSPIGITALLDGSKFYVANSSSNDVSVVSASSFTVLKTIPLASGASPMYIASDPTSSKVYTANQGTSNTTIIQTSNDSITQSIAAPAQNPSCTGSCAMQTPVMIITQ
jgi:YVTN family beta-propeller protein